MKTQIAKIRLTRSELVAALGLPEGSEIKAATTTPDEVLILFIGHPEIQERSGNIPAPEMTLDELRGLGV